LNPCIWGADVGARRIESGVLYVTISVVTHLHEVLRSRWKTSIEIVLPCNGGIEIARTKSEDLVGRYIQCSGQVYIIDLGTEVDATATGEQTSSDPIDPDMLQIIGCSRPVSCETGKKDHLLTSTESVDDSYRRVCGICTIGRRTKTHNLPSSARVGDLRGIMPKTLRADACTDFVVCSLDSSRVGKSHALIDTLPTTSAREVWCRNCHQDRH